MIFQNPNGVQIESLLRSAQRIAVCGLSANPARPSYRVSRAMQRFGYQIIPVNPRLSDWQGLPAVATLDEAAASLPPAAAIDIVNVFRHSSHVHSVVEDCIRLGLPALWLQMNVVDEAAALRARAAGMTVIMDRCISVDRTRMET